MSDPHSCPFCSDPEKVIETELAFAHYDTYPVSKGHCLIIPRRHVADYFLATAAEKAAIWELVDEVKKILDREFSLSEVPDAISYSESQRARGKIVITMN